MKLVYANDCSCADTEVRASWVSPVYLPAGAEVKALVLWQQAACNLMRDFYGAANEQRYYAIHVGGRHLLAIRSE